MTQIIDKIVNSELAYKLFKETKETARFCQYQVIHELQLQKVREKFKRGEKIRVVFMVMQASKFGYDSIIDEMKQSRYFDPIVFVASHQDLLFSDDSPYFELAKRDYELVKRKGYETFFAYDEFGNPKPLWEMQPDIVFYNELTNMGYYKNSIINREFLTCYVGYGIITSNRNKKNYRTYQRNACWKIFLENKYVYEQYAKYSCIKGMNAILSGYPKLDKYVNTNKDVVKNRGRKLVIYAPHWSINDKKGYKLNFSTFPMYYERMLNMVKKYKDVDFIFKPHPRLGIRIHELDKNGNTFMSYSEYERYLREWDEQENGKVVLDGDYIELFMQSDCMIMDSGSFIFEYLLSGNPCIYLLNPKKKNLYGDYNEFAKRILQTYYCCIKWDDIEKLFVDIIYKNTDTQKEEREKMYKEFINVGCAGKKITEYLLNEISLGFMQDDII